MAGIEYSVAAVLQVRGTEQGVANLNRLAGASDKAGARLSAIASSAANGLAGLGSIVSGAVDRIVSFGVRGAVALGSAGLGLAMYGVKVGLLDINRDLENTKIGFATIFNVLGAASGVPEGLRMAGDLMGKIREDAKQLPGEFGDFVGVAQTISAPMVNLGQNIGGIRSLTRDTAVAAAALGVGFDQAGREMALLLEGHAGAHNILGMRLGVNAHTQIKGQDFNKASGEDRLDFLKKLLEPTKDSLVEFQHSWNGMTSTLVDTAKSFAGRATAPIFEAMKGSMGRLLQWTETHQDQINAWADTVGGKLLNAYHYLEEMVESLPARWARARGPIMELATAIKEGWKEALPWIDKAMSLLEKGLHHPVEALKILAGLKVGGLAAQALPGALSMANSVAGLIGGGGGAAAGAGAGAGAAAVGGAGAAALAAPAVVALAAVTTAVVDDTLGAMGAIKALGTDTWGSILAIVNPLIQQGGLFRDVLGLMGRGIILTLQIAIYPFILAFKLIGVALDAVNAAWEVFKAGLSWVAEFILVGFGSSVDGLKHALGGLVAWLGKAKDFIMSFPGMGSVFGGPTLDEDHVELDKSTTATSWVPRETPTGNPDWDRTHKKPSMTASPSVDARGSQITIQLNVKDTDPDRLIRRVYTRMGQVLTRPIMPAGVPAPAF